MGDTNNNQYMGGVELVAVIDRRPTSTSSNNNFISGLPAQMYPVREVTDQYIKFVSKTAGRDKLCRMIQYSSKFAWWYIQKSHYKTSLVKKLKLLDSSISLSRKMFRFGKSFEVLNSTFKAFHIDDVVLRTLVSLVKINSALFLLFDNMIWLDRVGVVKINRSRISELAAQFWLASIMFGIGKDLYQLQCATDKETIKNCSGLQLYVYSLLKNKPILFDLIRNTSDLPLSMAMLRQVNLSPGVLGLLGMISSYIGMLTEWNPDYKLIS